MTEYELALVRQIGDCYTRYVGLVNDSDHPAPDQLIAEFASEIHDLQARVMWLAARRAHRRC